MDQNNTEWLGFFSYGEGVISDNCPKASEFKLKFDKHRFFMVNGIINDSLPGIPEEATFRGFVFGTRIRFTKLYKTTWVFDESGNPETMNDHVKRVYKQDLGFLYPANPIHYAGTIQPSRGVISGKWYARGDGRLAGGASGTWEAKKIC